MWFNNALIYRYQWDEPLDLANCLAQEMLKPCPPHARFIQGWVPALHDELIHEVTGAALFCFGKEEKVLPRAVLNRLIAERIERLESTQNRKVKRNERAQLLEELEFELLPQAFSVQKKMYALLDKVNQHIIVNTSSETQASALLSLARRSCAGLQIEPLMNTQHLAPQFSAWINNPDTLPPSFQLASDCILFSLNDEKKRITCKGYELPAEEILSLLERGLAAAEISLIWNERIQFTLTHELTFKRLKSLDYLTDEFNDIQHLEENYQQEDAKLLLLSGELRQLTQALLTAFSLPSSNLAPIKEEEKEDLSNSVSAEPNVTSASAEPIAAAIEA